MVVSRCSDGQMPGSGETSPKPVLCAMPIQPDHTSAAAGAARTSNGQDRTVPPGRTGPADRSETPGPPDWSAAGPRGSGPALPRPAGPGPAPKAATEAPKTE